MKLRGKNGKMCPLSAVLRGKKVVSSFLIIILLLSLVPCNKAYASEDASINKSSIKLYVSGLYKLKVSGAADVEWSSDDESIATVTQKGYVRAKKAGSTEIVANVNGTILTCKVTVKKFTKKEAERLVRKYIEAHDEYGFIPQFISVDHIDGNTYVVHAYDNGDGMSMTYNWYDVNKTTGKVKEESMY
jgi:uncharacterized protein YjdB